MTGKNFTLCLFLVLICIGPYTKAKEGIKKYSEIVFGCSSNSIEEFEDFVKRAKELGATHIQIQAEDLPLTWWQMDTPGDPYPAWVITNPGLLKTFIPQVLKKYIPATDADKIISVLKARCEVLRKYKLKAAFHSFEPQMLPELVYIEHPEWRGPRVDQPLRSRVKRYAPSIENDDILALYKESVKIMLEQCPEIEILEFRTNDSGAGISWSKALYAGANGNEHYKKVEMQKRLGDFFKALQSAGSESGKKLEVHLYNTKETDLENLVKQMPTGTAVDNSEAPGDKNFKNSAGTLLYYRRPFAPAAGIPWVVTFLEELERANTNKSSRLFISIGDRLNRGLYLEVIKQFNEAPAKDEISRLQLLEKAAVKQAGENLSGYLLSVWLNLNRAEQTVKLLDTGGTILILGGIHERWITRPFVPFPGELKPEEKDYYRKFQFQARTEKDADNLTDMQAGREFEGSSGSWFVTKIMETAKSYIVKAQSDLSKIIAGTEAKREYQLLDKRLEAYKCLLNNAVNAVSYQALLDRIVAEKNSDNNSSIEKSLSGSLRETAQSEIENTKHLIGIVKSEPNSIILDLAADRKEEYQRQIGPDILEQLARKTEIMNAHLNDYSRLNNK